MSPPPDTFWCRLGLLDTTREEETKTGAGSTNKWLWESTRKHAELSRVMLKRSCGKGALVTCSPINVPNTCFSLIYLFICIKILHFCLNSSLWIFLMFQIKKGWAQKIQNGTQELRNIFKTCIWTWTKRHRGNPENGMGSNNVTGWLAKYWLRDKWNWTQEDKMLNKGIENKQKKKKTLKLSQNKQKRNISTFIYWVKHSVVSSSAHFQLWYL